MLLAVRLGDNIMPTTRKRRSRSTQLTTRTLAVLGVGMGINNMPDEELQALWKEYGAQVTDHWRITYGHDPFVATIASREGW